MDVNSVLGQYNLCVQTTPIRLEWSKLSTHGVSVSFYDDQKVELEYLISKSPSLHCDFVKDVIMSSEADPIQQQVVLLFVKPGTNINMKIASDRFFGPFETIINAIHATGRSSYQTHEAESLVYNAAYEQKGTTTQTANFPLDWPQLCSNWPHLSLSVRPVRSNEFSLFAMMNTDVPWNRKDFKSVDSVPEKFLDYNNVIADLCNKNNIQNKKSKSQCAEYTITPQKSKCIQTKFTNSTIVDGDAQGLAIYIVPYFEKWV
jgi:hypothetical protein